jgi:hypothetical protein
MWRFASLGCCHIAMLTGWHGRLSTFQNLRRVVRSVKEVFTGAKTGKKPATSNASCIFEPYAQPTFGRDLCF